MMRFFEGGSFVKKPSDLSRLMGYAGNYRYFTYASWALSAASALLLFCLLVRDIRTVNGRGKPLSAALQRTDATDDLRL